MQELLDHLGLDPARHSTPDIKRAIDEFMSGRREGAQAQGVFAMRGEPVKAGQSNDALAVLRAKQAGGTRPEQTTGLTPSEYAARGDALRERLKARASGGQDAPPPEAALPDVAPAGARPLDAPSGGTDLSGFGVEVTRKRLGNPIRPVRVGETAPLASRQIGGLRAAPRPGAVPKGEAVSDLAGRTVSDLATRVKTALGIPVRQGRITGGKNTLGEYHVGTGVVRTRAVHELDVLGHEATHALEGKNLPSLNAALRQHDAALSRLAYDGAAPGVRREEGFAEFGRWYLTNPDHARRVGGQFYDDFEAALQSDAPEVLADLRGIQQAYRELLSAASLDVAAASVAQTGYDAPLTGALRALNERGLLGAAERLLDMGYRGFIDRLHPLNVAVRKLQRIHAANHGQRLDIAAAKNPYSLARIASDAYGAGAADAMHGVTPYKGIDPEGPSMSDVLRTALGEKVTGYPKESLRQLDAYLIARRMVHEWDRYDKGDLPNPPDRNTREFHEQVIADAERLNPTWRDAAGKLYEYQDSLWRKEFEAGFITREQYQNGIDAHPDYVPLYRDVSDKSQGGGRRGRGAMQYAGGVKAFEGSTRDVISPLTSIARRTFELNANIHRNEVIKALAKLGDSAGPGSGEVIERLPPNEVEAVNIDAVEALRRAAEAAGVPERDLTSLLTATDALLDGQTQATMFRQRELSPRKGEAIVFMWENGKKVPLLLADGKFGEEIFEAVSSLTPDTRNVFLDVAAAGAQALRLGVTAAPEFMQKAVLRDLLAAWINTDTGLLPPAFSAARGLGQELAQSPFAKRYEAAGGLKGGANASAWRRPIPKNDAEAFKNLQRLNPTGRRVKRFMTWRGFGELTDVSDTATRLGIAKISFDKAKRRGLNDSDALVEAVMESRDFFDPTRIGAFPGMMVAARTVPFLNSSIQGLDKAARVVSKAFTSPQTAGERRAQGVAFKAIVKMSALAAVSMGLLSIYAGDPEFEEFNDYTRATNWLFKLNGRWFAIPKPYEHAFLANLGERVFEGVTQHDPRIADRILKDMFNTLVPPSEATALAVPYQIARNRDHFGKPIVPDHLKGQVEPRLQFSRYTSETAKVIGGALRVSPSIVEHVLTGFGGTWGRYAKDGGDWLIGGAKGAPGMAAGPEDAFGTRGFVKLPSRGSDSEESYWRLLGKEGRYSVAAKTYSTLAGEGREDEALRYLSERDGPTRTFVLASTLLKEPYKGTHPLLRAQASGKVIADVRAESRDGELVGADGQLIRMTPQMRRAVDNALDKLSTVEVRNGQIAAGVRGWSQRKPLDRAEVLAELRAASPAAYSALEARWAEERVVSPERAARAWATISPSIERADQETLRRMMLRKRAAGTKGAREEMRRRVVQKTGQ